MKQQRVFPECNVDTNFVGHLLGGVAMQEIIRKSYEK